MPTETIKLTLPMPPSANRYWRKTFQGRVYVSEEAKAYRQEVGLLTLRSPKPLKGQISVTIRFYRARKSGDLDNRLKILFDVLQGLVYEDDEQIIEIHAFRFDNRLNPRVEVEIREI